MQQAISKIQIHHIRVQPFVPEAPQLKLFSDDLGWRLPMANVLVETGGFGNLLLYCGMGVRSGHLEYFWASTKFREWPPLNSADREQLLYEINSSVQYQLSELGGWPDAATQGIAVDAGTYHELQVHKNKAAVVACTAKRE